MKWLARRFVLGGLLLLVGGLAVAIPLAASRARARQPIAFPHQKHVEEAGMACLDCHRHVMQRARATIPNIEVCADCHQEAVGTSEAEALVVRHVTSGEPIAWQKVHIVPDHVYFSHRRHAALGGIACETCHGPVSSLKQPFTAPFVRLEMEDCQDCHAKSGVSNDCILCHR